MPIKKRENERGIVRMTDKDILATVKEQVEKNGGKITNTQGMFILDLIDYAIEKGDRTSQGLRIYLTEDDMSSMFGVSKSFVIKAMEVFTTNGIIDRTLTSEDAKKIYGDGRVKTKPTTIFSKYVMR